MSSYFFGKDIVCAWIRENFSAGTEILDVGACDGIWRQLLPEYTMDAVEIHGPNADRLHGYRKVFRRDVDGLDYEHYDLIIFGDVIEHMDVEKAQRVLAYARPRCRDMVVAVPFLYPQDAFGGNPWEKHLQPDLTAEIFAARYPGFSVLCDTGLNYCYYHKENGE